MPSTPQLFERVVGMSVGNPDIQLAMVEPLARMLRTVKNVQGEKFDLEDFTTWVVEEGLADESGDYNVHWWSKLGLPQNEEPNEDPEFFHRMLLWSYAVVLIMSDRWSNVFGGDASWRPPPCYGTLEQKFGALKGVITLNYDMLPEHMFSERGIDYGFRRKDLLVARDFHRESLDLRSMHEKNFQKMKELGGGMSESFIQNFQEHMGRQDYHRINADNEFQPGPFPVLKVHGGMNICHCPECDTSIVLPPWFRWAGHKSWDYPGYEFGWARTGGHDASFHCRKPTATEVPPNMEKFRLRPMAIPPVKQKEKLPQWPFVKAVQERAVALASDSERLLVVGASMRSADGILWDCVKAASSDILFVGDPKSFESLKAVQPTAKYCGPRLETSTTP